MLAPGAGVAGEVVGLHAGEADSAVLAGGAPDQLVVA